MVHFSFCRFIHFCFWLIHTDRVQRTSENSSRKIECFLARNMNDVPGQITKTETNKKGFDDVTIRVRQMIGDEREGLPFFPELIDFLQSLERLNRAIGLNQPHCIPENNLPVPL